MRIFLPQEASNLVLEFDASPDKKLETESYYRNSYGVYNLPGTLDHVDRLTKLVRETYPTAVFSNTYTREYRKGSELKIHVDRKDLDVTISVCLEKTSVKSWPLKISRKVYESTGDRRVDPDAGYKLEFDAYDMPEGSGVMCEGRKYPHWRDPFDCADNERAVYVFYHWSIPATLQTSVKSTESLPTPTILVGKPALAVYDNFLSEAECALLIWMAQGTLTPSTVVDTNTGDSKKHANRTSSGMFFTLGQNAVVQHVESKIAALTGFPVENGEGLQILKYEVGQEYKPHYDYFDPKASALQERVDNNRICTVLIYLSTPKRGGSTIFPDAGIEVAAKRGTAVVFAYPEPVGESLTLHGSTPVIEGEKWSATKWIRKNKY